MKTSIVISDALLRDAKILAERDGTTLRALVEEGLRQVVRERQKGEGFKLRDGSFKGEGLMPEFAHADWDKICDASYEGRGG